MTSPIVMGWEEWVALPDLGLPALKTKVDTGAKTSALHAHRIEIFESGAGNKVRFVVNPLPGRDDIEIACEAMLVDRREVMSSNGERETRCVIATTLAVGGRSWPIEITLTDRAGMTYRMLLGRQAIQSGVLVDPSASFIQPRLSPKAYGKRPAKSQAGLRPLRLAIVTRQPATASIRALVRAGERAGHQIDVLDVARLALPFDGSGALLNDGQPLPRYDAAIPRFASGKGSAFALACLRQLETAGAISLNPADALERLRSRLSLLQPLDRLHIPVVRKTLHDGEPIDPPPRDTGTAYLVVGRRVMAIAEIMSGELVTGSTELHSGQEAKLARRAAQALHLGLAAVEIKHDAIGPLVAEVSTVPKLARFASVTGIDVARLTIEEIETRLGTSHRTPG